MHRVGRLTVPVKCGHVREAWQIIILCVPTEKYSLDLFKYQMMNWRVSHEVVFHNVDKGYFSEKKFVLVESISVQG